MLSHTKDARYDDAIYCPTTHQFEGYTGHYGDEDPLMESCDGCQELIEVDTLQTSESMVSA